MLNKWRFHYRRLYSYTLLSKTYRTTQLGPFVLLNQLIHISTLDIRHRADETRVGSRTGTALAVLEAVRRGHLLRDIVHAAGAHGAEVHRD